MQGPFTSGCFSLALRGVSSKLFVSISFTVLFMIVIFILAFKLFLLSLMIWVSASGPQVFCVFHLWVYS